MSTTTPNFNFPVPQSTDLVKDGATAIAALGTAIDTDFVDLKGGTTGQVLSKASNTDLDFSWVAQDDSNAIQNTIVDAKGDLIAASAADTPARLAVGSNGETLVADSTTSTGLRYQGSMAAGKNASIGGGFDIWQRGTSFASGAAPIYTADRWMFNRSGGDSGATVTRQATGDTTNLPFIQYCGRVQRNSGNTATTGIAFWQSLETVNSIPYAGKTITFSFYARAGANYSSASNVLTAAFYTGTGTDQNINVTGYTGQGTTSNNATLTTTWQRFSYQIAVPSTTTEMGYIFSYTPSGTAGANDYFEITGVQVEVGSVATQFTRAGGTIQGELAACQRYLPAITTTGLGEIATGFNISTTQPFVTVPFQVPARVAPTGITATAGNLAARNSTGSTITLTAVAFNNASPMACAILGTVASGLVAGNGTSMQLNGTILFTGCEL